MASDDDIKGSPESAFSFGVRELRSARMTRKLELDAAPIKHANANRGSDPYNTSGSFDRKKHWARVGKR